MIIYHKRDMYGNLRISSTDFDVGDTVKQKPGSGADTLSRSEEYEVLRIEYTLTSETTFTPNGYESVYRQKLHVKKLTNFVSYKNPNTSGYFASNFNLLRKGNKTMSLQIEDQKPCVAVEIDTNAEGEDVIKTGAEWMPFDTPGKAKAALSKIISDDIREKNVYRRFRLYTNSVVAGAKQPEIEFK